METRCSPRCECYQNASRRENNTSVVMILRALGRPVSYFPGVDTWFGSTGQLRPESRQRVGKAAQLLAEGEPRLATKSGVTRLRTHPAPPSNLGGYWCSHRRVRRRDHSARSVDADWPRQCSRGGRCSVPMLSAPIVRGTTSSSAIWLGTRGTDRRHLFRLRDGKMHLNEVSAAEVNQLTHEVDDVALR